MTALSALKAEDFDKEVISRGGTAILGFTADWCEPCAALERHLTDQAARFPQAAFFRVDVDLTENLASQNRINGIPAVLVFRNGEEYRRLVGAEAIGELASILDSMEHI